MDELVEDPALVPGRDAISPDELRRCTSLIEAVVADRSLLLGLPPEDRRRLLIAAGRMSRPDRDEQLRLMRASRKERRRDRNQADREARGSAEIRLARQAPVFTPPLQRVLAGATAGERPRPRLRKSRHCYVCKEHYEELHFFYDAMCTRCGDFNYAKRFQTTSLQGRVAVITGARVKIGYHAALKMLRAGARVVVTTRFPRDAAERYAREPDFGAWAERLHVHGLDLRHAPSVEIFCRYLGTALGRLDFLINNAAQTVRRPPGYYKHMLDLEEAAAHALTPGARLLLTQHAELTDALALRRNLPAVGGGPGAGIGVVASAALSQIPYSFDDASLGLDVFPAGALDADLQQIDLRGKNSWRLPLAEVPTPEMMEVQLVNAVAPFILCAKLKSLMLRQPSRDKHIVNVSAMEGQFSRRTKTDKHPHTNMAKAALNMMTLTSAPDYLTDGIHMNAVDTGWVTDEDPAHHAVRKQQEIDFHPPLDIIDGAARICDPFIAGLLSGEHVWGKFLKDYAPVDW